MNKKHKKFAWFSGLVLLVIIGVSSTMFASKSLLSAKEEAESNDGVVEKIVFPANPLVRKSESTDTEKFEEARSGEEELITTPNISLKNLVPKNFSLEPVHEAYIGLPFHLDMTFSMKGNLNSLRGGTYAYSLPGDYLETVPTVEAEDITINGEVIGSLRRQTYGNTFFEVEFNESANLDFGENEIEVNVKPLVQFKQDMAYTDRDIMTKTELIVENKDENDQEKETIESYPFTILPHSSGVFDWADDIIGERTESIPFASKVNSPEHWESYPNFLGNLYVNADAAAIRARNPQYPRDIPAGGNVYWSFGMTAKDGRYYTDMIAICIDIFHSLIYGNGQAGDLEDYIGREAAEDLQYGLHMGAMLAENGDGVGLGVTVDEGEFSNRVPLIFNGSNNEKMRQQYYLFAGQYRGWRIASNNNLNPQYRLKLEYEDFTIKGNNIYANAGMEEALDLIEQMIVDFKNTSYIDRTPTQMKVGETRELFQIPANQKKFIHYVDFEESTGLDKVTLVGVDSETGVFNDKLSVKANTNIDEGEVDIVIRKNTSDFWNSDLGFDALNESDHQKKAVFSMRKEYHPETKVSVYTDSDYNLEIEKTDEAGKPLLGAEFMLTGDKGGTAMVPIITSGGKFTFEGLEPEVTYTLTETKAPEGYQKKEESYTIVMDANGKLTVKEGTKTLAAGQDYKWDENKLTLSFQVENTPLLGDAELVKTDSKDGHTLVGAEFTLYKGKSTNRGEEVGKYTTDSSGKIKAEGLVYGDYHFVETKAPEGYELDPTPVDFTISDSGTTVSLSKKNSLEKEIILTKIDKETKQPLEGAVFIIQALRYVGVTLTWDSDYVVMGEKRKEFTTDANGEIVINDTTYPGLIEQLSNNRQNGDSEGKVYGLRFREIQAPQEYPDPEFSKNERYESRPGKGDNFSVNISDDYLFNNSANANETKQYYTLENSKTPVLGDVELVKVNFNNQQETLDGAIFDLYTADGKPVQENIETKNGGKITITGLPLGEYYFIETKAPEGYDTPDPDNKIEFSITKENASANIAVKKQVTNIKENVPTGFVKLYKYDSKDKTNGLAGAEFALYQVGNNTPLESNIKTDSKGMIERELPLGEYYFVETKAPDGYYLNGEKQYFTLTEAHNEAELAIEVEVSNIETPPRELTLSKIDEETREPIPNVEFIIQNKNTFFNQWGPVDTGSNKAPLITDKDGKIIINDTTYPGLIDHLIDLNSRGDVGGLRFREISTPDGWEDPYPTGNGNTDAANNLLANNFAKDIPMDSLIGSPLFDDPIYVNLTMTNKKEQSDDSIIQVEKRDKETGNLITDGEATFIIQSLREDGQWSAFSDEPYKTENGVAVIDDKELINDLLNFQGGENDQKYRFREIEAPEGYKDPQAPSPLSAKEAPGGVGDEFSKEFTLDKENPSTVTVVIENEKPEDPVDPVDRAVTLKKEDDTTDKALQGAVFEIEKFNKGTERYEPTNIGRKTTGNDGKIALTEQEINSLGSDYPIYIVFKEVTPPGGYEMPANPYSDPITITAEGATPDYVLKENHAIQKDREMILKKVDGFSNMPLGEAGFQIYKEDENGEYKLYDELSGIYYTEPDGEYVFDEHYEIRFMENGNYKLKEVVPPEGYELPDDPFTEKFTVTDAGVTPNRLVKKNYKISGFMLKKVDQTGKPVKGAKFHLYKYPGPGATGTPERYIRDDYRPDDWTDENGEIIIDRDDLKEMPDGVYFWREIEAPDGYEILEQDTKTFTVQNGIPNPPIIQHVNQYNGRSFEFHKVDDRNGAPYDNGLNGAVFELEKEVRPNTWEVVNDKQTDPIRFTTQSYFDDYWELDVPGSIYLNDQDIENYGLANGTYRLREIKAPPGYELPEDPYTRQFVLNGSGFSPDYVEKKNSRLSDRELILKKVDGRDQNKGLAGAEFELEYTDRDDDGWYTYEEWNAATQKWEPKIYTTDEKGEIVLDEETIYDIYSVGEGLNLKGRFKEVKAPDRYLLPDDVYSDEFIIRATEIVDKNERPITEIKKINYRVIQNYELELLKVNDNEVRLDGAEFTLVPTEGSAQAQVSKGDKGIFNFKDLEPDVEYTLTETKAPDDYFINKTPYTFILRTDEDPDGILEVYYNGKLLEEGKDYEWNNTQLRLSLVIINRKTSMPITGSIGILSLLIAGATAIGVAYNFQLKKKKVM